MTHEPEHDEQSLDDEELEEQNAEPLPDREVMNILPIEPTGSRFLPEPPE